MAYVSSWLRNPGALAPYGRSTWNRNTGVAGGMGAPGAAPGWSQYSAPGGQWSAPPAARLPQQPQQPQPLPQQGQPWGENTGVTGGMYPKGPWGQMPVPGALPPKFPGQTAPPPGVGPGGDLRVLPDNGLNRYGSLFKGGLGLQPQ